MLAANGSIFTILAISFERYYAICKPLKAGYKCTRLRATIIICLIWLLSSLLTSPILMMAKSSETVYIDGSLVYNCILETDSYWPKMYVFVSMFAFFCLPLLVLMFVYWLIGRRLIRENLAMSTSTNVAASNSARPTMPHIAIDHKSQNKRSLSTRSTNSRKANCSCNSSLAVNKKESPRSVYRFFSSLHHHNCYHECGSNKSPSADSNKEPTSKSTDTSGEMKATDRVRTTDKNRMQPSKTLSLDHNFTPNVNNSSSQLALNTTDKLNAKPNDHSPAPQMAPTNQLVSLDQSNNFVSEEDDNLSCADFASQEVKSRGGSAHELISGQISRALHFVHQLFHRSALPLTAIAGQPIGAICKSAKSVSVDIDALKVEQKADGRLLQQAASSNSGRRQLVGANRRKMMPIRELTTQEPSSNANSNLSDDPGSQAPFLPATKCTIEATINATTGANSKGSRQLQLKQQCVKLGSNLTGIVMARGVKISKQSTGDELRRIRKSSKFAWAKSFSISSSFGGSSDQTTTTTILPDGSFISYKTGQIAEVDQTTKVDPTTATGSLPSPKPIIHYSSGTGVSAAVASSKGQSGPENISPGDSKTYEPRKKMAHFEQPDHNNLTPNARLLTQTSSTSSVSPTNTSNEGSSSYASSSAYSSKSSSPDLIADHATRKQVNSARLKEANNVIEQLEGSNNSQRSSAHNRRHQIMRADTKLTLIEGETSGSESELDSRQAKANLSRLLDTNDQEGDIANVVTKYQPRHAKLTSEQRSSSLVVGNGEARARSLRTDLADVGKRKSLDRAGGQSHHGDYFLRPSKRRAGSSGTNQGAAQLTELLVVQDLSKKQQMDSRRQVVIMLAFVVACFFLLFFPYRVFTIWLILSTEDQVQSLGMETYYNLTYFSRILIYLHSAINPIAYNLISTKFRRAFMSILLCRGSSSRRHFTSEHRLITKKLSANSSNCDNHKKPIRQTN